MPIAQSDVGVWRPSTPVEGAEWMAAVNACWWIAGGWAIDMFAGRQSRSHADLDIGILRREVTEVLRAFAGWEICEAHGGVLTELLAGALPRSVVNSLWCRPRGAACWTLEFVLDESVDDHWVFRRQPAIRRPLASLVGRSAAGIPYLAPEIQLLFKAKNLRDRDQLDFDLIVARLDTTARIWLRDALARSWPSHEWIQALGAPVSQLTTVAS